MRQLKVTSPSGPTVAALPQSHSGLAAQLARVIQAGLALPLTVTLVKVSPVDAGLRPEMG